MSQVTKEFALSPVSEASKMETDYTWDGGCLQNDTPFPLSPDISFPHSHPVLV
jgi:hypothetical protein